MQNIIYNIINKLFMNEIEDELLGLIKNKDKIIFDVGCHTGNFTKNLIKFENKTIDNSKYYLFDPNPKMQNFLNKILENENVNYFPLALDNTNEIKKFTINRYFEASGSSLKSAHKEDKTYNISRN